MGILITKIQPTDYASAWAEVGHDRREGGRIVAKIAARAQPRASSSP
ncbi:hypothetical protein [Rhodomicrobium lacus]|nr:hypothetical protein [Rhodomicrobium lacus]